MDDYKKKYEHALNNFKKIKAANKDNNELVDFIEYEYPELKESEDERIRRGLIARLSQDKELHYKEIAWLEKQSKQINVIENFDTEFEKQVSCLIASVINKEHEYNEGFVKWTANALLNYAKHELEKQGEQKIYSDELSLLEKFKHAVYDCAWGKVTCKEGETKEEYAERWSRYFLLMVRDWADDYIDYNYMKKLDKAYEKGKQSIIKEKKPTDKIEPKFKVGDVVRNISNGDTVTIAQIDKENQFYNYSGWDGAATVHSDFSFAEQEEWQLIEQKPTMCLDNIDKDLLKSAKSQLKPAWSGEDEEMFNDIIMCLDGNFRSDKSMINWLKSLKERLKGE